MASTCPSGTDDPKSSADAALVSRSSSGAGVSAAYLGKDQIIFPVEKRKLKVPRRLRGVKLRNCGLHMTCYTP